MKPIIGIIEWPYIDYDKDQIFEVSNAITNCIIENGGVPIGIFPTIREDFVNRSTNDIKDLEKSNMDDLERVLSYCDAIIKPGALRIYNYEKFIYEYCLKKDIPYLGICAGMQLMTHSKMIPNSINHKDEHYINIKKDTLLYEIIGKERIKVNSKHKYQISDIKENSICCYSDDGTIEGIYNKNKKFILGLQWHPELINDENSAKIFQKFIENAKK